MQSIEAHLSDAIEAVSTWDPPDEDFADALNAQTRLMCGISSDEIWRSDLDVTVQ